jgi:DNA-binding transcriptional ArsR family regulator
MGAEDVFDRDLLKALGHPLRLRILEAISDAGEASPVELAGRLGRPLATVSHHVRLLRDLGFLELARTEPRRGAVEHFYRVLARPFIDDAQWEQLGTVLRHGLATQTFRMVFSEAVEAGGAGGFDGPCAHIIRLPLELDGRGRRELSEELLALLKRAEAIQRRSDARCARRPGPQDGQIETTSLVALHYRTAGSASPSAPARGRRSPPRQRPRIP